MPRPKQVTIDGVVYRSIRAACEARGLNYKRISTRLARGESVSQAFERDRRSVGTPITVRGTRYPSLRAAALALGVNYQKVANRINSLGWTVEQALEVVRSPNRKPNTGRQVHVEGRKFWSISEAARHYGLEPGTVNGRLNSGWTIEQSVGLRRPPSLRKPHHRQQSLKVKGQEFRSYTDAAVAFGLSPNRLVNRLRAGWTPEEAVGIAKRRAKPRAHNAIAVTVQGQPFPSVMAACKHFHVADSAYRGRIRAGWTQEQAFGLAPPPPKLRDSKGRERKYLFRRVRVIDGRIYPDADSGEFKLYLITNREINKQYVGITTGVLKDRWRNHLMKASAGAGAKLGTAIRKYGKKSFRIELLRNDATDFRELQLQEQSEIEKRGTFAHGYNTTVGGEMSFSARSLKIRGRILPTVRAAASHFGLPVALVQGRLNQGWKPAEAVGLTKRPKQHRIPIMVDGKSFRSYAEAAAFYEISEPQFYGRIKIGWTPEQAAELQPMPKKHHKYGFSVPIKIEAKFFDTHEQVAEAFDLDLVVLSKRLKRGWSIEQAVGLHPPPQNPGNSKAVTVKGKTFSNRKEAAKHFGVSYATVNDRLSRGWDLEEAVGAN